MTRSIRLAVKCCRRSQKHRPKTSILPFPLPALPWIATGLLIAGVVFLAGGALLIAFPVRGASRDRAIPASG